jgi:hypothetical protein
MARFRLFLPALFLALAFSSGCGKDDPTTPSSAVADKQNPAHNCVSAQCDFTRQYCLVTQAYSSSTGACYELPSANCTAIMTAARQAATGGCAMMTCSGASENQFTVVCQH